MCRGFVLVAQPTPFRVQRIEFNGRELGPGEIARACTAAGGTQVCVCVCACVCARVRVEHVCMEH